MSSSRKKREPPINNRLITGFFNPEKRSKNDDAGGMEETASTSVSITVQDESMLLDLHSSAAVASVGCPSPADNGSQNNVIASHVENESDADAVVSDHGKSEGEGENDEVVSDHGESEGEGEGENDEASVISKNDIGLFAGKRIDDATRERLTNECWMPDENFAIPRDPKSKRKFSRNWFKLFPWMAYSHVKKGIYCRSCVLYLANNISSNNETIDFIKKPHTNYQVSYVIIHL